MAFFSGGGGGASGPIVGTASVGRHGTKRQAVVGICEAYTFSNKSQ
jgi:hypothetical protein